MIQNTTVPFLVFHTVSDIFQENTESRLDCLLEVVQVEFIIIICACGGSRPTLCHWTMVKKVDRSLALPSKRQLGTTPPTLMGRLVRRWELYCCGPLYTYSTTGSNPQRAAQHPMALDQPRSKNWNARTHARTQARKHARTVEAAVSDGRPREPRAGLTTDDAR